MESRARSAPFFSLRTCGSRADLFMLVLSRCFLSLKFHPFAFTILRSIIFRAPHARTLPPSPLPFPSFSLSSTCMFPSVSFPPSLLLCISPLSLPLHLFSLSLHVCLFPCVPFPLSLLLCLFPFVTSLRSLPLFLYPSDSPLCLFPIVSSLPLPLCL
jgi:hypothetical protein